ncbi:hypothetical protein CROQUDRAFT_105342 [Cronartium quercuum f. sp. fusiforme G11]|uniref:Uncharacterized protein n=1 Tax=Cronartium quercuum f. sp. fusiforme G11 TaxID=708437 RepID=A0A9P6TE10_9BASI|nr:hypothetical protein CROQUDRAFT_105342 [Cronartium quercuum f. sp. fusiforme G11]
MGSNNAHIGGLQEKPVSKNVVTGSSLRLADHARTISEEPVTTFIETTVLPPVEIWLYFFTPPARSIPSSSTLRRELPNGPGARGDRNP